MLFSRVYVPQSPDAGETFYNLEIYRSSRMEEIPNLVMNNLKIADHGVDGRDTRPQSSSGLSFPNIASTILAVGSRASTPETSLAGPVIPTRGYRAVVFRAAKKK